MKQTNTRTLALATMPFTLALTSQTLAADDGAVDLGKTVVTASGFEQSVMEAPASITVLTRDDLETRHFRDLAEALSGVEGIDVLGSTGKAGGLDIRIRGMSSDYTLILLDGRRQNLAGDSTPNGFGDTQNSLMPPLSAIERIEVIRGPMSTLYGADAMGGVINIITRKVASEWGGTIRQETGTPESTDWGVSQKTDLYASGPLVEGLAGLTVRGGIYHREESELVSAPGVTPSGRNPAPGESRQYSLGARLMLTPHADHDIWLDVDRGRTWYNNDDARLGTLDTDASARGYEDALEMNRDQIAIGHSGRFSAGTLDSSLMRTINETLGRTIPTSARVDGDPDIGSGRELETTNTVLDTKFVAPIGLNHKITVGGQYWNAELIDGLLPDSHHSQNMWSVFAEDEWHLSEDVSATFGARRDDHDAFGEHISPRLYLVWNASEQVTVKGGISQGFKAPDLNQLIDGVNGVGGQGTTLSIGNPELDPEVSTSKEIALLFDNMRDTTASVTLFHNKIKDKISDEGDCTLAFISSCAYNPTATYDINIDEAKTWGAELTGQLPLGASVMLSANYTWTDSEVTNDGEKDGQLSNTPEHMANAQLRWAVSDAFSLWLRGEYHGESNRFSGDYDNLSAANQAVYDAVGDLQAYTLFHLGGAYQVSEQVALNASISNLADKDFRDFSTYDSDGDGTVDAWASEYFQGGRSITGTTLPGRTFWLSANVTF